MFSGIVIYYFFQQSFKKRDPLHNQSIPKQTSVAFLICLSYPFTATAAFSLYLLSHHSKGIFFQHCLLPWEAPENMQAERSQSSCALRGKGCTVGSWHQHCSQVWVFNRFGKISFCVPVSSTQADSRFTEHVSWRSS